MGGKVRSDLICSKENKSLRNQRQVLLHGIHFFQLNLTITNAVRTAGITGSYLNSVHPPSPRRQWVDLLSSYFLSGLLDCGKTKQSVPQTISWPSSDAELTHWAR